LMDSMKPETRLSTEGSVGVSSPTTSTGAAPASAPQ
jgi:hypothetical protein